MAERSFLAVLARRSHRSRIHLNEALIRESTATLTHKLYSVEEQLAAVASTVDLIVEVRLPEIIKTVEASDLVLAGAIRSAETRLRREVNQKLKEQANNLDLIRALAEQANIDAAAAARMASAHAVNLETLKALMPQVPDLLGQTSPDLAPLSRAQLMPIVQALDELRNDVRKLETPDFMANLKVLQDLERASWPEIGYATAHVLDDVIEIGTNPGKTTLQATKLIARAADVVKQWYLDKKHSQE